MGPLPEASEEDFSSTYKSVAAESFQESSTIARSSHVSRMNKLTAQYCMDQAKALVQRDTLFKPSY